MTAPLEEVRTCELCGDTRQRIFEVYERFGEHFPLVECEGCGLGYLNRRPTEAAMPEWYDRAYGTRHRDWCPNPLREVKFRMVRALLRLRQRGGPGRLAALPLERRWQRMLARNHMQGTAPFARILDVGCGHGAWLAGMRRFGFDCHGVDTAAESAEAARTAGLAAHHGSLESAAYPDGHFAVVRFHHVLEHLHHPVRALTEAARILAPGGRCVVTVPNHAGVARQVFRHSEDVPYHLYAFTPDTLGQAMDRAGLRRLTLHTETPHPHSIYSYLALRAVEWLNDAPEATRRAAEEFWSVANEDRVREFRATMEFFDAIGRGTQIVAVGERP
ncbi:SAM-dependent methyltransferase [Desulfobaculum xiamenense]|uniref:SAM-dependent methyltransferase n=1 Tax=Desulfobaculum xiamenense TaxID=995050 RepID=A0A846QX33_9BACT|nr:methyltransferase domain-containing protein [Desulfobaculum xiamenense]NJB69179.1 SAM-dependent methyltransferase [Desulfobaculum xiamenense]